MICRITESFMKRSIFTTLLLCLFLSGCYGHPPAAYSGGAYGSSQYNTGANTTSRGGYLEQCDIIIKAFMENDPDSIKDLFCKKVKDTHNLDRELFVAMRVINGNIVSYNKQFLTSYGSAAEDGKYVDVYSYPWILDVTTDTGDVYYINFFTRLTYADEPDEVGVQQISICDTNYEPLFEVGEYIEGHYGG